MKLWCDQGCERLISLCGRRQSTGFDFVIGLKGRPSILEISFGLAESLSLALELRLVDGAYGLRFSQTP